MQIKFCHSSVPFCHSYAPFCHSYAPFCHSCEGRNPGVLASPKDSFHWIPDHDSRSSPVRDDSSIDLSAIFGGVICKFPTLYI